MRARVHGSPFAPRCSLLAFAPLANTYVPVNRTYFSSIIAAAEKNAQDLGLDLSSTASQARATAQYTGDLVELANNVLSTGYFGPGGLCEGCGRVEKGEERVKRGREMAVLAGAIYAGDVVEEVHGLEHSVVARGISQVREP